MKLVLLFLLLGFLMGAIYGVLNHIVTAFKNHFIVRIITDILFCLILGYVFVSATTQHLYGEIRAYLCVFFALSFIIERKTLGKLFAKLFLLVYNGLKKYFTQFKSTRLGKIIFK